MANQFITLKDITALSDTDGVVGLVDNIVNVAQLLEFLKDCRPDAEVYHSLYAHSNLGKIRQIINNGNYVQFVEQDH